MATGENLSGIYKSCWNYPQKKNGKTTSHESITALQHFSNNLIIGFEIYDGKNFKNYAGMYFLQGQKRGEKIQGCWLKLNSPEYGDFTLNIKNDQLSGTYNNRHSTAPNHKRCRYTLVRLVGHHST